jgi:hypothetical protein
VSDARLEGTIADESGSVIPGAAVTVSNMETGLRRSATTDGRGRYIFSNLPPATYHVEASVTGFKTSVRQGVTLTVGASVVADLSLEVGAVAEQVTVTGEVPLVETRASTVAGVTDERMIRELPLNGRSFADLVKLEPGVIETRAASRGEMSGNGAKMSIGGARPHQMSFTLDGADMMTRNNTTPAGVTGIMMGVEAVQEFRVSSSGYSAEFGRNSGGAVSAITKSGTNQFHGTIFHFLRNDNLDAKEFFDEEDDKPEFKRNQFGFAMGGPIVQNRTFFFGSYEVLLDRQGTTSISTVPTLLARQGIFPNGTVPVEESVRPYLALYPEPNGNVVGNPNNGLAEFIAHNQNDTDQHNFMVKVDHHFSASDFLTVRSFFDDGTTFSLGGLRTASNSNFTRIQNHSLSYKRIVSPTVVNDFRVSYLREGASNDFETLIPGMDDLSFIPGRSFGSFSVNGMTGLDGGPSSTTEWAQNLFEYADDVAMTRGDHSMKFGGLVKRLRYNSINVGRTYGQYIFGNLRQVLAADADRYEAGYTAHGMRGARQWMFGFFAQDDWRAASNLTFNVGLRYEVITSTTEVGGRVANLRNKSDSQVTVGDPWFLNPSLMNFAPRFGFAWDVAGDGKTAIRGGVGIFFDQLLALYWRDSLNRILPWQVRVATLRAEVQQNFGLPKIPFPNAISLYDIRTEKLSDPVAFLELMNYQPHQPYTMQYNFTINRQVTPTMSMLVGYMGAQSRNQSRNVNANPAPPAGFDSKGERYWIPNSPRMNRNFGIVLWREFDGTSNYNSLQLGVLKLLSHGFSFKSNYQYSRTMDQQSGIAGSTDFSNTTSNTMDPFDRNRDYSRAAFDIRHYFVLSGLYEVPTARLAGLARSALGGWKVSSIFTYSGGEPLTVANSFDRTGAGIQVYGNQDRPSLAPGASTNPLLPDRRKRNEEGVIQWFDPLAFVLQPAGYNGDVGRMTVQGPDFMTVDLGLTKEFPITESKHLAFRWELFNMFDRVNFGLPNRTIFTSATARNASAGRITSTRGSARQMQFALKLVF